MPSLNSVHLIGNVTRDIEVRYTPNGTAVADVGLAVNETYGKGEEKKESVTFVNCVAWGKTAEAVGKYVKKGDPLFVDGRLLFESWEKDGIKRSTLKVTVNRIQFLAYKKADAEGVQNSPEDSGDTEVPF